MCTITVHRGGGALRVTMNRDEARTRPPEREPEEWFSPTGMRCVGPLDSERGGTWIGVNERGLIACLMNGYRPADEAAHEESTSFRSRGEIVPDLLAAGDFENARDTLLHELDPSRYPSFTVLLASTEKVESYGWFGASFERKIHEDEWNMIASSSWRTPEVLAWRDGAFAQWRNAGCPMIGYIPSIHLLQPAGKAEWSPLMDRSYAATRSITQVELDAKREITLRYWPRTILDPGVCGEAVERRLSLSMAASKGG